MTQTQEPMDCSDGARMLIDRMRTNPEDFNYGGKLYRVTEQAQMSARDKKAYNIAHDLYIVEPALMASVLQALLTQPEEEKETGPVQYRPAMTLGPSGNLGIGTISGTTANKMWFNELTNTAQTDRGRISREMYEDHIQTHAKLVQDKAVRQPGKSIAAQIYNKALGRERIERDN